jgi:transmembrane sensor
MMGEAREPISEAIYEEASRGFVRRERSPEEEPDHDLAFWLEADPRHAAAYAEIADAWEQSQVLAQSDLVRGRKLVRAPFYMRRNVQLAAIAATAILVVGFVSIQGLGSPWPVEVGSPVRAETYRTALGEIRTWRLADGTVLTLDTDSAVVVTVEDGAPQIAVRRGRVRVDGRQGTQSAPMVTADELRVDAGGGVLDVSVLGSQPSYAVIEGNVRVTDGDQAAGVDEVKGQTVRATASDRKGDRHWPQGMIELDHMPLGEAARTLNRYNSLKVRVDGQDLMARTLSGGFRLREPEAFARAAASAFDLDMQRHAGEIVLSPRAN